MTSHVNAWLLEVAPGQVIAVSESSIINYSIALKCTYIPTMQSHISYVLEWRKKILPVFDFAIWLQQQAPSKTIEINSNIAIISYKYKNEQHLLALKIYSSPEKIRVSDKQYCHDIDLIPQLMRPYCRSIFQYQEKYIAVLSLSDLLYP